MDQRPIIYLYYDPEQRDEWGKLNNRMCGVAVAEDGTRLGVNCGSSLQWLKHDMANAGRLREIYRNKYPNGYRLEWTTKDELFDKKETKNG